MTIFKAQKVVSVLPATLNANTIYTVRVGEGFDLYISDNTGSIAHQINNKYEYPVPSSLIQKSSFSFPLGAINSAAVSSTTNFSTMLTNGSWGQGGIIPCILDKSGFLNSISLRVETAFDSQTTLNIAFWDSNENGVPNKLLSSPIAFTTELNTTGTKTISIPSSLLKTKKFKKNELFFMGLWFNYNETTGALRTLPRSSMMLNPLMDQDFFNFNYCYGFFSSGDMFIDNPLQNKIFTFQPPVGIVTGKQIGRAHV